MKIACLGWGSLIWQPGSLALQGEWSSDGPLVPVEFCRQSSSKRVTLVIEPNAAPVHVLWAVMSVTDLQRAKEALRDREGLTGKKWESNVGSWQTGQSAPQNIPALPEWVQTRGLDAVIWTALGPKFEGNNISPSAEQVVASLRSLDGVDRDMAEEYVRCAPQQVSTEYRRLIEQEFEWTYREC